MSGPVYQLSPTARPRVLDLAKTIAWSFFGVRKKSGHDIATQNVTLPQLIVAGVVGAGLLVACFLTIALIATS